MHLDLTQGDIKPHIFKLAVPAVIGYFFHTMFNVTDTYFAGMISTEALAALSLSASVFFMILAIAIGMSEALTSLTGNALGEKDMPKAQHVALNGLVFSMLLSISLSIIGLISTPYLVEALGDPSYVRETLEYINIILYGVIFFVSSFFLNALLNALGDTKSFRNILIFTAFLNILLDYMFVKYFETGVKGIALATIMSECVAMLYLFYKLNKTQLWHKLSDYSYDGEIIKKLLVQGMPPSVNMFMMAFGMYIITYFVADYGKEAVAAYGIGMRIEQIFLMPIVGLNIAVLSIVSQNSGAKAYERISPTVNLGILYGFIISAIGVVSFFAFGENFASTMTTNPLVIAQTALYLKVSGFAFFAFVLVFIYVAMLQGIGKPAIIAPISVYRQLVAPIVVFSILSYLQVDIIYLWFWLTAIIFSSGIYLWWYAQRKLKSLC